MHFEYCPPWAQEYPSISHRWEFDTEGSPLANVSNVVDVFYFRHWPLLRLSGRHWERQSHRHRKHNHKRDLVQVEEFSARVGERDLIVKEKDIPPYGTMFEFFP